MATFSTVSNPGATINYKTGEFGGRFLNTSGATVVITQLGRWVVSGNSQSHTLKIYNASTHELLDSVVVNCSGAPAAQFLYGTLPNGPINVASGSAVDITSTETAGSEIMAGPNGQVVTLEDIGTLNPVEYAGGTWTPLTNSTRSYGPINFQYTAPIPSWTYDEGTNTYTTDGTFYQVKSALADSVSHPASIVNTGAITTTWFVGGGQLTIPEGITLSGDSQATTIINMSTGAVLGYTNGSITLNEGSVVRNMTINGPDTGTTSNGGCVPFITSYDAGTWRISYVTYNQFTGRSSYFINIQRAPTGLIDHCTLVAGTGTSELIYSRGPADAWAQASGIGDANAVYVENCTFSGSGQGYCNDANDNGKVVFRFNTIAGGMKIDGHGRASNSLRGVRRMEVYCNDWTYNVTGGWQAIEARGGKNVLFNNRALIAGQGAAFYLRDYGYLGMYSGFQFRYQTPYNYPLMDQIGVGPDETVNATTISAGDFVRIATVGTTVFTDFGAASNTPGVAFFATGTPTGTGTVTRNAVSDPSYVFGNLKNNTAWARTVGGFGTLPTFATNNAGYSTGATSITLGTMGSSLYAENAIAVSGQTGRYRLTSSVVTPAPKTTTIAAPGLVASISATATTVTVGPNTNYQYQQSSTSASFTETDIVQTFRDFYSDAGFDASGTVGVTVGTAAQMAGTSAAGKLNQGFWVTDEGTWNTENNTPGAPGYQKGQGQLYVSDNTNWVLAYTPYTYPYSPTPPATPGFSSAEVRTAGTTLAITFSVSVSTGSGGAGGVTVAATGGAVTWSFDSGVGTPTYVGTLSRTIVAGEVVTVSYTQPGDGIQSTSDGVDAPSFTAQPVTNNSAVNDTQATNYRSLVALGGGF